jgi:hypothetical protein
MRRLVAACAFIACLAACSGATETITDPDAPFGGVYSLRQVNGASLPLYFWAAWYPGRASMTNVQSSSLVAGDLSVLPDGSFVWSTQLDEVALKSETLVPEYVVWKVRRDAYGKWTYTPETGVVSLTGSDQSGTYVLTGTATGGVVTLSSTLTNAPNQTFVLER